MQTSNYFGTLKGNIFLESVCAKVRNSGLLACNAKKKGQFRKEFLGIFKVLEHRFLS